MGVSLDKMVARLRPEEREAVHARTSGLIAQEMSLRDLRKALGKTQAAMADKLGIRQENVSRIEQRSDMLLSTLDGYLRGMGGRLRLVAEFDSRPSVELSGFAAMAEAAPLPRPKASATEKSKRKKLVGA